MQVEGSKLSVRLKLSDFIENFEEIVISRINKIYKDLNRPFVLYLWYDNEEVSPQQLKSFMLDWEASLNWKTIIRKGNTVKINEGIWYNISPVGEESEGQVRFQYSYPPEWKILGVMKGLDNFYECAKFCTSPKPPKRKQKRNDYEESGHSGKSEIYE